MSKQNGNPEPVPISTASSTTPSASPHEPQSARDGRENRHKYFMNIAMAVRLRANCKGNRVGAIIVLDNRIISTGYNGTPENMTNCLDGG